MKKLFVLVLALVLVLGMSANAYAEEMFEQAGTPVEKYDFCEMTKADFEALALKTFPEYEDEILGKNLSIETLNLSTTSRSGSGAKVIERRQVNDGLYATLLELIDGVNAVAFELHGDIVSSTTGSGYSTRTVNFAMYSHHSSGQFMLNGFRYTLVQNSYDAINNRGTTMDLSGCYSTLVSSKLNENASGPAYVEYMVSFPIILGDYVGTWPVYVELEVGGDEFNSYLS